MARNILLFIVAASALAEIVIGAGIMIMGLRGLTEILEGQMLLADLVSQLDKTDSELRFFAGMRFTIGLAYLYALFDLKNRREVLYVALLAMFFGGFGRFIGIVLEGPQTLAVVFTIVETSMPAIGYLLYNKLYR